MDQFCLQVYYIDRSRSVVPHTYTCTCCACVCTCTYMYVRVYIHVGFTLVAGAMPCTFFIVSECCDDSSPPAQQRQQQQQQEASPMCPQCFELFTDERVQLPCRHFVCERCPRRLLKLHRQGPVACPVCWAKHRRTDIVTLCQLERVVSAGQCDDSVTASDGGWGFVSS